MQSIFYSPLADKAAKMLLEKTIVKGKFMVLTKLNTHEITCYNCFSPVW